MEGGRETWKVGKRWGRETWKVGERSERWGRDWESGKEMGKGDMEGGRKTLIGDMESGKRNGEGKQVMTSVRCVLQSTCEKSICTTFLRVPSLHHRHATF
jgi:hypothetical protein